MYGDSIVYAYATSAQSLHVRKVIILLIRDFETNFVLPRQLNGVIFEFNANLNEYNVAYLVSDR